MYTGQSPIPNTYLIIPNTITFFVVNATNGAVRTNAQLTGAALILTGMYLTELTLWLHHFRRKARNSNTRNGR